MIELNAKKVYIVPWKTNEDKNWFNEIEKYGFYPHPTESGAGNAKGHVDIVIFKPITVNPDHVISNKLIEALNTPDVYQYFKVHGLLEKLKINGITYRGVGANKKVRLDKKGRAFLPQCWYACIDYREEPTIITIRTMLLPFFEFANAEIIEDVLPEVKSWVEEGKAELADAELVKQRYEEGLKSLEQAKKDKAEDEGRDIVQA